MFTFSLKASGRDSLGAAGRLDEIGYVSSGGQGRATTIKEGVALTQDEIQILADLYAAAMLAAVKLPTYSHWKSSVFRLGRTLGACLPDDVSESLQPQLQRLSALRDQSNDLYGSLRPLDEWEC